MTGPRDVPPREARSDTPSLAVEGSPADQRFSAISAVITDCVSSGLDLYEMSARISTAVQSAFHAEASSILLLDGEALEFVGVTGPSASHLLRGRLPLSADSVPARVALLGEPALLKDTSPDVDWVGEANQASGFAVHAQIACPLFIHGATRGVVQVLNPTSGDPFSAADLSALQRVAPFIATALAQSLLLRELRQTQDSLSRQNAMLERRVTENTLLLANAKQEWELTFDALADPLAIVEDGIIRRTNLAFGRVVDMDVRRLPGLTCHQARFGSDVPCSGCLVAKGGGGPAEAEIHHEDGIFVRRAFRLDGGRPNAWVVSYQDVTESRKLAARLQESEHRSAIGRLAAGAAHEINNPMSFLAASLRMLNHYVQELSGFAHQVRSLAAPSEHHQPSDSLARLAEIRAAAEGLNLNHLLEDADAVLQEGEEGTRRVSAIVRALEILGQSDEGQSEEFDLLALARAALRRASQSLPYPISVRWLQPQPTRVLGRPFLLEQALYEIFRNAAQANPAHGAAIEVAITTRDGMAAIEVADHGPGIPTDHCLRVLEPFFTTRAVGSGVGLGLTVAYGVARRHGGRLEIETNSEGTQVRLTLPINRIGSSESNVGGDTSL